MSCKLSHNANHTNTLTRGASAPNLLGIKMYPTQEETQSNLLQGMIDALSNDENPTELLAGVAVYFQEYIKYIQLYNSAKDVLSQVDQFSHHLCPAMITTINNGNINQTSYHTAEIAIPHLAQDLANRYQILTYTNYATNLEEGCNESKKLMGIMKKPLEHGESYMIDLKGKSLEGVLANKTVSPIITSIFIIDSTPLFTITSSINFWKTAVEKHFKENPVQMVHPDCWPSLEDPEYDKEDWFVSMAHSVHMLSLEQYQMEVAKNFENAVEA